MTQIVKTTIICLTFIFCYQYTLDWLLKTGEQNYGLTKVYIYKNNKLVKEDILVNDRVKFVFAEYERLKKECEDESILAKH
jgi:hypothetical protein